MSALKRKDIIMKKIAKALLLVAMTVGMAVACDPAETSTSGSVSSASSENSSTSLTSSDIATSTSAVGICERCLRVALFKRGIWKWLFLFVWAIMGTK